MTHRSLQALALSAATLTVASCGGTMSNDSSPGVTAGSTNGTPANLITISGSAFMPATLRVAPGAMVTVRNLDPMPHTVTSQAATDAFRPGSVAGISFDTGQFMGQATFMIPTGAAVGTVIPFFSTVDTTTMMTPTGTIEISAQMPMQMQMPEPMPMMPMSPM